MWSLFPRKTQVSIILALGFVISWTAHSLSTIYFGGTLSTSSYVSIAATGVMLVGFLIGLAWRSVWGLIPVLNRVVFPDLNGTWSGEVRSSWTDPETGLAVPSIPVTIVINQGLFDTSVKLTTDESTSYSHRCVLERSIEARRFRLWYTYDNQPRIGLRYRSSQHEGAAWLQYDWDLDQGMLRGNYFTVRPTAGDIEVRRQNIRARKRGPT